MTDCDHVTWLRWCEGRLEDSGRLGRLIKTLTHPSSQCPQLIHFIGSKTKESALRQLFPHNRRKRKIGPINLHLENTTLDSANPLLFADSNPFDQATRDWTQSSCHKSVSYISLWPSGPDQGPFDLVHARLLFLFSDVVCVFADDFPTLSSVAEHVHRWVSAGSASSLPQAIRPALIIVTCGLGLLSDLHAEDFRLQLHSAGEGPLSNCFRCIKLFRLPDDHLAVSLRYLRLKEEILYKVQEAREIRLQHCCLFSGVHLDALFQQAVRHTASTVVKRFSFIRASRLHNKLGSDYAGHLQTFFELCVQYKLPYDAIASFIASSILVDAYPPRMHRFPSQVVFRSVYRLYCLQVIEALYSKDTANDICHRIEAHLQRLLLRVEQNNISSTSCHADNIRSQYPLWSQIRSNRVCLLCVRRPPERVHNCGHAICDICVRRFGYCVPLTESRYLVKECIFCLAQGPLIVDQKPKTAGVRVLTIDGGGARVVLPFEYLKVLEKLLGSCPLYRVIDFAAGSSSGGLVLPDIFILKRTVSHSDKRFNKFAGQCLNGSSGAISTCLGAAVRYVRYILTDAMYDGVQVEKALQEEYTLTRRLFDHVGVSGTRIALTTKSDNGLPSIMTNYNGSAPLREVAGYYLVRPKNIEDEPKLWEAARATSAAPVYFKPADIAAGSFVDGGLGFPNPLEVAKWEWARVWPGIHEPDVVISLGTGISPPEVSDFRRASIRHIWQSFMSFLDGESRWQSLENTLSEEEKDDYFRFNPSLLKPSRLDTAKDIPFLRQCAYLHSNNREKLATVAFHLLISNFYFVPDHSPPYMNGVYACRGSIHCRMDIQPVIQALTELGRAPLQYVTPSGIIPFGNFEHDICRVCRRYRKSIQFDVSHQSELIELSIRTQNDNVRKISGFPRSIASLVEAQGLDSPFGTQDHDDPGVLKCTACPVLKRKASSSAFGQEKRRRRV